MASTKDRRRNLFERASFESGMRPVRSHERRELARTRVDVPGTIEWDERVFDALISDLGIGGAFIRSSVSPPYGAYVHVSVEHFKKPVHLVAIVRWGDERGFGVQFDRLGAYETSAIAGLIARSRLRPT